MAWKIHCSAIIILFLLFTGNVADFGDAEYWLSEEMQSVDLQTRRMLPMAYVQMHGAQLHTSQGDGNFMTRHLLSKINNGSKNGSFLPPVKLSRAEKISFTVGYSFILLVGLAGNVIILVVIATHKEFHNDHNLLLCNLVVADILRMLTAIPVELFMINRIGEGVSAVSARSGLSGDVFCKWMFGLSPLFTYCFIFTLVFMTMERFVAIVFPFKAVVFKGKSKWIILSVWLGSIVLQLPCLYGFGSIPTPNGQHICTMDFSPYCDGNVFEDRKCNMKTYKNFVTVVVYLTFVGAFSLILALHVAMVVVLYKYHEPFNATSGSRVSSNSARSTRDVVRMIGVLSVVHVMTSLPSQIYQFGYIYDDRWLSKTMPVYFNFLLLFIANGSFMFNAWIYPLCVKRFREKYAKLCWKCMWRKTPRRSSHASTNTGRTTTTTNASLRESLSHKLLANKESNETNF